MGECEIYKEERHVLVEMRKIDECDMEEFGTLLIYSSEKTITILHIKEIDGGHRRQNRKGIKYEQNVLCNLWNKRNGAPKNWRRLLGVRMVLRLERDVWSMVN